MLIEDVGIMHDEFHYFASLPWCFASYFVTHIPKVKNSSLVSGFWPISLDGSLYTLVAKVLAKRFPEVMDKLISPCQSTFLKGRIMVDGVMANNELVDLTKGSRKAGLIFKSILRKHMTQLVGVF